MESRFSTPPQAIVAPQCMLCRHFVPGEINQCDAFPHGIPDAIHENMFDHRRLWPGQDTGDGANTITFDSRPDAPRGLMDATFAVIAERTSPAR